MARDKACADLDRSIQSQRMEELYETELNAQDTKQNYGDIEETNWLARFDKWATNKITNLSLTKNVRTSLTVKEQYDHLKSQYGPKEGERIMLTNQIYSMLNDNPGVRPHFYKYVNEEAGMVDAGYLRQNFPGYEVETQLGENNQPVVKIHTLPPNMVRALHAELYSWINDGKFFKKTSGRFGGIRLEYMEPSQVAKKDPTGMIFDVNQSLDTWNQEAQTQATKYKEDIDTVRNNIQNLSTTLDIAEDTMFDFFFRLRRGEIYVDRESPADGVRFKLSTKWVAPKPGFKHDWQKDKNDKIFTVKNNSNKEIELFISDSLKRDPLQKQAYRETEFLAKAQKALDVFYDNIYDEAQQIVAKQNRQRKRIDSKATVKGTKDLLEQITEFGMYSDKVDVQGLTNIDKKEKNYFTTMYHQDQIPTLLAFAQDQMIERRNNLEAANNAMDIYNLDEKQQKQYDKNYKAIQQLNSDIIVSEAKADQMDSMILDLKNNEYVQTGLLMKNFKRVTDIIHPKYARTDGLVLTHYVENLFRTIGRNQVTLDLMEAVATKGKEAEAGAVDYLINHYKSTFYFPDADTSFMGFKTSSQVWANRLNALPGGSNISPHDIETFFKSLSGGLIFNALNGPFQGLTNMSAYVMKTHDVGREKYIKAMIEYDKDPQGWAKEAEKAGVTQYTDFIEGHVRRNLSENEQSVITQEIKTLKNKINEAERTNNVSRLVVYRKQLKRMKNNKIRKIFDEVAQYAITRKTYHKKNENQFMSSLKSFGKFYGQLPSISDTEENLRTMSYTIGVLNYLDRNPGSTRNSPEAIEAGIAYTQRTDFGLSHQHVGLMFRGPIGGFLTRMKIWHKQRFSYDINVIAQAIRENTRPEMMLRNSDGTYSVDSNWIKNSYRSGSGLVKTFARILSPRSINKGKKLRLDSPYTARAKSHFWLHGTATALMDFVIYPLAVASTGTLGGILAGAVRGKFYQSPMGRGLSGFGSSYYSLMMGVMHFAAIMAKGGFDEDENISLEQFLSKYVYHVPVWGLGTSIIMDSILSVAHDHRMDRALGTANHYNDHIDKVKRLVVPGGRTGVNIYEGFKGLGQGAGLLSEDEKEFLENGYYPKRVIK